MLMAEAQEADTRALISAKQSGATKLRLFKALMVQKTGGAEHTVNDVLIALVDAADPNAVAELLRRK